MLITITIRTDNAAFEDDNDGSAPEVARICEWLAKRFRGYGYSADRDRIMDANGNTVGAVTITEE